MLLDCLFRGKDERGCPVTDTTGRASSDPSSILLKHGGQLGQDLCRRLWAGVLIYRECFRALLALYLNGRNFCSIYATLLGRYPGLLRAQGVGIAVSPANAILVCDILSRDAHGCLGVRVRQRTPQSVLEGEVGAQAMPKAHIVAKDGKGRLAHTLASAGERDRTLSILQLICSRDHGLKPTAAQTIHCQGHTVVARARSESDVTRQVRGIRRRLGNIAKDASVDQLGVDLKHARWKSGGGKGEWGQTRVGGKLVAS